MKSRRSSFPRRWVESSRHPSWRGVTRSTRCPPRWATFARLKWRIWGRQIATGRLWQRAFRSSSKYQTAKSSFVHPSQSQLRICRVVSLRRRVLQTNGPVGACLDLCRRMAPLMLLLTLTGIRLYAGRIRLRWRLARWNRSRRQRR